MSSVVCRVCSVASLALLTSASLYADPRGPFEGRLWGDTTLVYERYEADGDELDSPYSDLGGHQYGEINIGFEQRLGPYQSVRGQFIALYNDSSYRSEHQDFVPERIWLSLEHGGRPFGYRLEFGDTYTYFSQRSIQRTLKGIQLDLQSTLGDPRRRQSLQLVAGTYDTSWRDLDFEADNSLGASWVIDDPLLGLFGAYFLDNETKEGLTPGDPGRDQRVYGVTAFSTVRWKSSLWYLEGEWSHLEAQERYALLPDLDRDVNDDAYFLQLSGFHGAA